MSGPQDSRTSKTLLSRLKQQPADPAAWREFTDRYGGKILAWCRDFGLQDADAHDVTQDVLTNLVRRMRGFDYDPSRSFRGWLRTLTRHAWADFADKQRRHKAIEHDGRYHEHLASEPAAARLLDRLEEEFEHELFEEALARVRLRVLPENWEAFRMLVYDQRPGPEVAAAVGKSVAAIYMAKKRIAEMLQEEIRKLDDGNRAGL